MIHCNKEECKHYIGTATESHGICSLSSNYFPVAKGEDCVFKKTITKYCGDCEHFVTHDTACMGQDATDEVGACPGFEDHRICAYQGYLYELRLLGLKQAHVKTIVDATVNDVFKRPLPGK